MLRLAGLAGNRNAALNAVHAMQLYRVQGLTPPIHACAFRFMNFGAETKFEKGASDGNSPTASSNLNSKLYVCDCGNGGVQILNTNLEYLSSFGCHGDGDDQFNRPNDIAQDGAGNLYVTNTKSKRVQVFDGKGQFLSTYSKRGAASEQLQYPCGICVNSDQFVYVCEKGSNCVSVFKTSGEFVTSFGQFNNPAGILIDDDGFVYVGEYSPAGKIYIV